MADKPVTREEKYLAYLTGDYKGEIPKPITRKEKYLYELCLKGMGGEISPEEIKNAVNEYLEKNPVKPGATTEQAQQIEQNKTDISSLKVETSSLKGDLDDIINYEITELYYHDIKNGSYQPQTRTIGSQTYCFAPYVNNLVNVFKVEFGKKLTVNVQEVSGINYKYRYGFYDAELNYVSMIDMTTDNIVEQKSGCSYIGVGIYSLNKDGTDHANIISSYDVSKPILSINCEKKENVYTLLDKKLDKKNKEIVFLQTDLKYGSLQGRAGEISGNYTNSFGYNKKLELNSNEAFSVNVPKISGVTYKYRFSFYNDQEEYITLDDNNKTGITRQKQNGKYVMFCVYATDSDGNSFDNVLPLIDSVSVMYNDIFTNDYVNKNDVYAINNGIDALNKDSISKLLQIKKPLNETNNGYKSQNKPLILLHFSDIHGDFSELKRINNFYKSRSEFDDIVCSGDIVEDRWSSDFNFWKNSGADNILISIGNHDVLTDTTGYDWTIKATEQQAYERYFKPFYDRWGVIIEEGKTYYYKDYSASKIRMIVINNMLEGSDETEQLSWLENILMSTPSDYTAFVVRHYLPYDFIKIDCNFSAIDKSFSGGYLTSDYLSKVNSFIQNGGKFACWLCGHTHLDLIGYSEGYPNQLCIAIDASNKTQCVQYSDVMREVGDKSEDLFNAFCIDTSSNLIKLVRFGVNSNRYSQDRNSICINYNGKTIISQN